MEETKVAVKFEGNTKDWFVIWIVNILLSIVTLGIYSSWATVRKKKYFYNNTVIEGRKFDFHATGTQIFIARFIALLVIVLMFIIIVLISTHQVLRALGGNLAVFYQEALENFSGNFANLIFFGFFDYLIPMLVLVLCFFVPWVVITKTKLNAQFSSFDGTRFGFHGAILPALLNFAVLPSIAYVLVAAPLGFAIVFLKEHLILAIFLFFLSVLLFIASFAFIDRRIKQFLLNNYSLGLANFGCNVSLKPFLRATSIAVLCLILFSVLFFVLASNTYIGGWLESGETIGTAPGQLITSISIALNVLWFPAYIVYKYRVRNSLYGALNLDDRIKFYSDVNPQKATWISLSNIIVIVLTLGLMYPWAKIRLHRYLCEHTYILSSQPISEFE